jgi:error-prone DNA polymerase
MGWENPPIPWHELEQRMSWRRIDGPAADGPAADGPAADNPVADRPDGSAAAAAATDGDSSGRPWGTPRPVTRLPRPARLPPASPAPPAGPISPVRPVPPASPAPLDGPAWIELHCHSSYSFLDGASSPDELVAEAIERGLAALAITDHDGMYGVPQFAQAVARRKAADGTGLGTIFGAELSLGLPRGQAGFPDPAGQHLLVLARDAEGYRRLCQVISDAQLAGAEKGRPVYDEAALAEAHGGHWLILTGCRKGAVPAALAAAGQAAAGRAAAGYGLPVTRQPMAASGRTTPGRTTPGLRAPGLTTSSPATPGLATPSLPGATGPGITHLTGPGMPGISGAAALNAAAAQLRRLTEMFGRDNVAVELASHNQPDDDERNDALFELAAATGVPSVATNNVHYASPSRAPLAQVLAAVRARRSLDEMDGWLAASGGAYIRSGAEMAVRLQRYPGVFERTIELGRSCAFDFSVVAPNLPDFPVPDGGTEAGLLRDLVTTKAPRRYGPRHAERVPGAYAQIDRELAVIEELRFPGYFLIVHDIVRFCEESGILVQGRGSAANSAVCYAIGITSVDPVRHGLLFERFLSSGRDGPPDIDLDIEHRRREQVIQYVYATYGRDRAAQVANVISYRPRMAMRDAGRALGYPPAEQDSWAKQVGPRQYGPGQPVPPDSGIPPEVVKLSEEMQRLPRHLGIHSGGMVICDRPVGEVCPVEWARMPGRTVLQWDKDDCAYAGLVKFDLLGLGMLSALRDCFELVEAHHGARWTLDSIPQEDSGVYAMLQVADTIGVFQVESRAQMATLPRLRPERFYDLVIEVALIRPGPIQGGSVHPYMRRKHGEEPPDLPHPSMEHALGKTLGVPLFQEQMMQIAIDCAGFSPTEADRLRQAMSSKRAPERIEELRQRLLGGMAATGIRPTVAEDIYEKILAFSNYGFPESHAISFAYLVYASAWLKCYYPAAFTAALLRSQPMGFYAPASLISDARRHGVHVASVDINASAVLATLENPKNLNSIGNGFAPAQGAAKAGAVQPAGGIPVPGQPTIRLGLSDVRNLGDAAAAAIVAGQPYTGLEDFARRTALPVPAMEALATAGAFACFGVGRREALWAAGAAATIRPGQLPGTTPGLTAPALPPMSAAEETFADLWATGTYGTHPMEHIREMLAGRGVLPTAALQGARDRSVITVGGLVTHRQQPGTARGVVFLSLEDESGMANVICPPTVWARYRKIGVDASALLVHGRIERLDGAVSLLATRLERLRVVAAARSRDFR